MDKNIKKEQLGGVSVLTLLSLVGTSIFALNIFRERPLPFKFDKIWLEITNLSTSSYDGSWIKLIQFEFISNIILTLLSVVLIILILKRSKIFTISLISFFLIKLVLLTLTFYFQTIIRSLPTPTLIEITGTNFKTLMLVGIWIPYFMLSETIKESFIY